MNNSKMTIEMN